MVLLVLDSAACGGQTDESSHDAGGQDTTGVSADLPDASVFCNLYAGPVASADAEAECGVFQCLAPQSWCEGPFQFNGWGCCSLPPLPDGAPTIGSPANPNHCSFRVSC